MKSKGMKVLAILSRKGGAGKTMFAVNLAVAAQAAGHRVAIVDLDSQASASDWGDWREAETPEVISVHSARLPQVLHKLEAQGFTYVILDTPPRVDGIAEDAAKAADLAVIPCKIGAFDLKAIQKTIYVGNQAKCPMRIVLNEVDARSTEFYPAKRAVKPYGVPLSPCFVGKRVAFPKAVIQGLGVLESEGKERDEKAIIEIQALFRYITKEMEALDGTR